MSNEPGFDTGIRCPSCDGVSMLTAEGCKRVCPHCGYTENHEPTTTEGPDHG